MSRCYRVHNPRCVVHNDQRCICDADPRHAYGWCIRAQRVHRDAVGSRRVDTRFVKPVHSSECAHSPGHGGDLCAAKIIGAQKREAGTPCSHHVARFVNANDLNLTDTSNGGSRGDCTTLNTDHLVRCGDQCNVTKTTHRAYVSNVRAPSSERGAVPPISSVANRVQQVTASGKSP